ncbi:poly(A) polymerase large subunit [Canarypox virus]|uniref:Poly(A) polymerase catalytic subunit n=1 Tax=Canarypox virus TaxID=44088 RepID=PAP1_CNPV|nr:poly(A) polymerase large subunit [Canarypox virus]Q6VZL8.1 RecName: Full=Poly(A) polymerase catalytic subunit; AltName: Full=Poly(A) polymerase large subunit; Short=PAP-L [Canarypox virus]AAR83475.1 CNPV129 poly(A) polymerase large subunit PAPL [Canarypox virus]AWD84605.1 poly(A) polymerase large subunit [Canarypox virus]
MDRRNQITSVIREYLGRNPVPKEYEVLKKQTLKLSKIINFNKDTFFFLIKKNKYTFFKDLNVSDEEIQERIDEYFTKQRRARRLGNLLAIVELQKLLVSSFTKTLGVLTTKALEYYPSNIRLDYSFMEKIADNILDSYNVVKPSEEVKGRHKVSDLVLHVNKIMEEYLRRHSNSCICYGSYSLHLLNKKIEYGDIDILQTNARIFLINIAFLIRFITGRCVVLLKVPFLKNYVVIHDENLNHVMDSFNIKQSTMDKIPKIMIDNMYIVDPCIQLLNTIKMFSQIDRLEDIHTKFDKLSIRLGTLLEYTRYRYSILLDSESILDVKYKIDIQNRKIILDFKKYNLNYIKCYFFLDEDELKKLIRKTPKTDDYIDLEAVTNSEYMILNKTMYTYFSNTTLLRSKDELHPITINALTSHALLYHVITKKFYDDLLGDLIRSLMIVEKVPVYEIIPRDKKRGKHTIIDIEKDVVFH